MTVEKLLNVPQNERGWEEWTFAHSVCVGEIRQAVQAQKGIALPSYQLYPVNFADLPTWQINVQQSHNDFNAALHLAGIDLQDTDVTDERQRPSWVWNNWNEVSNARAALKI
jgi:hypothetical protein